MSHRDLLLPVLLLLALEADLDVDVLPEPVPPLDLLELLPLAPLEDERDDVLPLLLLDELLDVLPPLLLDVLLPLLLLELVLIPPPDEGLGLDASVFFFLFASACFLPAALIPNDPAFKLLPDGMPVALVAA